MKWQYGGDYAIMLGLMAESMPEIPRHSRDPGRHYFLLGPRGTGKSTWLRRCYPGALFVDLLLPDWQRRLEARPERLAELVAGQKQGGVVVLDEIQRVPALLDVVHALIEERPEHRFVLTGSSARKLRRAGTDLLGGRAALRAMHPFTAAELGDGFDFERALEVGLVPLVWAAPDPRDVLEGYAALYLREEVQMEGMVRRLGAFSRFLEAVSFSQACPINLSEVARECEVPRKTAQGYLEILEDLLLCFRVPAFTKRAKRKLATHPKFFFFDVGVYRALRPAGPLDRPEEIGGAALEGLVAQHLRAWIDYGSRDTSLYYWRTRAGSEVDFVVYGPGGFWALEVKHAARVRRSDLRALAAFRADHPEARVALLYRGRERLEIDGIPCLPCDEFLARLTPGEPLF
jgi:predicted AAA+ superfamily ATPase